uniref:RRM domain-containing protein n=1 Tax=Guillardia theta TaxID=55529 RepID=A0A7S4P147_GUITH|mmetsp:Transcript_40848/g.128673  ORF Transcript_40848/g.128673 Transcript_40848/m.128673 type:complete len:742 (+) Transcript_40848:57-2282(+)
MATSLSQMAEQGKGAEQVYPSWFLSNSFHDLSRTIVVSGITAEGHVSYLASKISSLYGDDVIEHCEVTRCSSVLVYVRFKSSQVSSNEELNAYQIAYESCFQLDNSELLVFHDGQGNDGVVRIQLTVRPAVYQGLVWVGEITREAAKEDVKRALSMLYVEPRDVWLPDDVGGGERKGWAVASYDSDEVAREVLYLSKCQFVCLGSFWPILLQPFAPAEQAEPRFVLSPKAEHAKSDHFALKGSLESDLGTRWEELTCMHCEQRRRLALKHFKERLLLLKSVRSDGRRDSLLGLEPSSVVGRANEIVRTIYVTGFRPNVSEETLKDVLEACGEGTVERVDLHMSRKGHTFAAIRFSDLASCYRALRLLNEAPEVPIGTLVVRRFVKDGLLWVGELDRGINSKQLKDCFSQFGEVCRARIACDHNGRSLGYGIVQFSRHSTASQVLAIMGEELFLLSSSSRPIRVEPYVYSNFKTAMSSACLDAEMLSHPTNVTKQDALYETCIQVRRLQLKQFAEVNLLRYLQRQERRVTEGTQRQLFQKECSLLGTLKAKVENSSTVGDIEMEVADSQTRSFEGFVQQQQNSSGITLWQGQVICAFTTSICEELLSLYKIEVSKTWWRQVLAFSAVATSSPDCINTSHMLEWEESITAIRLMPFTEALKDILQKFSSMSQFNLQSLDGYMRTSLTSPSQSTRSLAQFREVLTQYNLAAVMSDSPRRVYILAKTEGLDPLPEGWLRGISLPS